MEKEVCQHCGREFKGGEQVIEIRYGDCHYTAHPHFRVNKGYADYFHRECRDHVMIRDTLDRKERSG